MQGGVGEWAAAWGTAPPTLAPRGLYMSLQLKTRGEVPHTPTGTLTLTLTGMQAEGETT